MWLVELDLPSVVSEDWMRGQAANPLLDKSSLCTDELDKWGRYLQSVSNMILRSAIRGLKNYKHFPIMKQIIFFG